MNLKAETMGLALAVELPLIITDIQRAGPSTGMPTKTEQADLLMAMYGRHGESPVPILAAVDARRLLLRRPSRRCASPSSYMTPVILLTDGYLANGAEPWLIPDAGDAARRSRSRSAPTRRASSRTSATRRRSRARGSCPGTPGLEHRIGGLEKDYRHRQRQLRADEPRADDPRARPEDRRHHARDPADGGLRRRPTATSSSSAGAARTARIREAVAAAERAGQVASRHVHLRYLNPLPRRPAATCSRASAACSCPR